MPAHLATTGTGRSAARRASRVPLIVLLTVFGLVFAAGATALVAKFLSAEPGGEPAARASATPSVAPAIRLDLADRGAAVTLTWTDPSAGKVLFVVAYGRADGPADRTQRLPAGTTTITINGLNPALDYCFTVAGIESTTTLALSHAVCTRRGASAGPSAPASGTGGGTPSPRPSASN